MHANVIKTQHPEVKLVRMQNIIIHGMQYGIYRNTYAFIYSKLKILNIFIFMQREYIQSYTIFKIFNICNTFNRSWK